MKASIAVAVVVLAAAELLCCASSSAGGTNPGSGGASGAAGGGAGGGAGSSGQTGTCSSLGCSAGQICVAYRTVGGAQFPPDDAGACQPGRHLENSGTVCNPDFQYQCGSASGCIGAVTCACGGSACPTQYNSCSELMGFAGFVDPGTGLVCQQLAP